MSRLKKVMLVSLLIGAGFFTTAKAITADELVPILNNIFAQIFAVLIQHNNTINDHESRISAIEDDHPNLGGFSMSFSKDGSPKNVVVAAQQDPGGDTFYYIRSRYATSTEQISIDGVLVQRPYIANYAFVHVDALGNLLSVSNYIEAPDTENYIVFNVEESFYDPVSLSKTVFADTLREDWNLCSYGAATICMIDVTLNQTGEHVRTYNFSSTRGTAGPLDVDGLIFAEVRLEQQVTSNYARARAKGVGEVFRAANDGSWERRAIFYRANGVEGGSLAGTPFESGPLAGLFF